MQDTPSPPEACKPAEMAIYYTADDILEVVGAYEVDNPLWQ